MSRSTLQRQWVLLQAIPRQRQITIGELHDIIVDRGFPVSKRTIERDLEELELIFMLKSNKSSRPYGWRWDPLAKVLDIPGMDPTMALSFKLVEKHLERLMPRSSLQHLQSHFERANEVLEQSKGPLRSWTEKICVIPRGQRLQEPVLQEGVMDSVYQALLEERQFKVRYRIKSGQEKEYIVHPLGLVLRDQLAYLVCTLFDYGDTLQLVLHRMHEVELLDEAAIQPEGFSLQAYIQASHFDYPADGQIRLEALFEPAAAQHLAETPLSDDQQSHLMADGRVRIRATVMDTQQLRWWLLGFGDQVEVAAPAPLRATFAAIARRNAERYELAPA
jgi:predicted DNA-binding transcriptional regulator YafY